MLFNLGKEATLMLLEGTKNAIPFNIVFASLIVLIFLYNRVPISLTIGWYLGILLISMVRWLFADKILTTISLK